MRIQNRTGVASGLAQATHSLLTGLGVDLGDLVSGPLDIRGHAGYVCRWGEKWFWEFRDGGPGWDFPKHDKSAVKFRIDLLLAIFRREARSSLPSMLVDLQESIADVNVGPRPALQLTY